MDIDHAKSELQQMAGVKKNGNPVKILEKGDSRPHMSKSMRLKLIVKNREYHKKPITKLRTVAIISIHLWIHQVYLCHPIKSGARGESEIINKEDSIYNREGGSEPQMLYYWLWQITVSNVKRGVRNNYDVITNKARTNSSVTTNKARNDSTPTTNKARNDCTASTNQQSKERFHCNYC